MEIRYYVYPKLAKEYIEELKQQGINAKITITDEKTEGFSKQALRLWKVSE